MGSEKAKFKWLSDEASSYVVISVVAFSQGSLVLFFSFYRCLGLIRFGYKFYAKGRLPSISFRDDICTGVIKPVWGLCTDMLPICSYRRKSYLMLFGFLGFIMWNLLAHYGVHDRVLGIIFLLSIQICVAFCNVVGEALLVEASGRNADNPNNASKNVSLFFGIRATGTLMTAYLSGYSLKYLKKEQIFMITSIFPLMMAGVSTILKEKKTVNRKPLSGRRGSANVVEKDKSIQELVEFLNIPAIYKPILFIFVFSLAPAQSTAMFYFQTVKLKYTSEFLGQTRFLYALATITAVYYYNKKLKNVPFKTIFIISTLLYCTTNCFTILLVTRENLKLGIPDKLFSLADTILLQLVCEINTLPILILACKICPSNIEGFCVFYLKKLGTMYALLMATINLGELLAKQIGGILMFILGINENNFDSLWILILIKNVYMLIPLFFVSLIKEDDMMKAKQQGEQIKLRGGSELQQRGMNDFVERGVKDFVERGSKYDKLSLSVIEDYHNVLEDL